MAFCYGSPSRLTLVRVEIMVVVLLGKGREEANLCWEAYNITVQNTSHGV